MSIFPIKFTTFFLPFFLQNALLFLFLLLFYASAQTNENDSQTNFPNTSYYQDPTAQVDRGIEPYANLLWRVIGILAIFSFTAFFVLRFIRRQQINHGEGPVKLIYDFPLSINRSLKVVQVVNDFYLLGVSQDNIQLICKLEDKETIDTLTLEKDKTMPKSTFFQEIFSNYLKGVNIKKGSPLEITKKLKTRLKKME